MTFRNRVQYLLVKRMRISNKEAFTLIGSGQVKVNGQYIQENSILEPTDEVSYQDTIIREGKKLHYIAFYKPRGIETTLNETINDNLKSILPFDESLFPVGRLDKESEGLLLLTNDGRLMDKTLRKEHETEKEYVVKVDKPIDADFIHAMANGISIMGQTTLPCFVEAINEFQFRIILVQGLNRQIRRMCYKLDYDVTELIRVRIGKVSLQELTSGQYRRLTKEEL